MEQILWAVTDWAASTSAYEDMGEPDVRLHFTSFIKKLSTTVLLVMYKVLFTVY